MNRKALGFIALATTITTYLWLVIIILEQAGNGVEVETMQQALAYISNRGWLFYLNYANAGLITLAAAILYTALYFYLRQEMPLAALLGLVFVPVYCTLNLFSYLSQITLIPRLLALRDIAEYRLAAEFAAASLVQLWPGSLVAVLNSLAYALLGIPSLIFGAELQRRGKLLRAAGLLLGLNGIAAILGFAGITLNSELLMQGTFISGVLFSIGLIPLTVAFFQKEIPDERSAL